MGRFDIMYSQGQEIQVNCFKCHLDNIHQGDKVGDLHDYGKCYDLWKQEDQFDTYTIVMSPYTNPRFALIRNRTFLRFTENVTETYPPYVSRYGVPCDIDGNEITVVSKQSEVEKVRNKGGKKKC